MSNVLGFAGGISTSDVMSAWGGSIPLKHLAMMRIKLHAQKPVSRRPEKCGRLSLGPTFFPSARNEKKEIEKTLT